jgi:hypothetical protein
MPKKSLSKYTQGKLVVGKYITIRFEITTVFKETKIERLMHVKTCGKNKSQLIPW